MCFTHLLEMKVDFTRLTRLKPPRIDLNLCVDPTHQNRIRSKIPSMLTRSDPIRKQS